MKVFAYIDGFNEYHYLKTYISNEYNQSSDLNIPHVREYEKNKLKWCNVKKLVSFFISEEDNLYVKFFTAYPYHRDTGQKKDIKIT